MRRTLLGPVLLALALAAGCGDSGSAPAADPRPVVFEPGQLVYAERSILHVGSDTYDLAPRIVDGIDWTPYGVYLELVKNPRSGASEDVFFDGETTTPVPDDYGDVITSPGGELAAWIDLTGPEKPAGQVAQVVVVDTATGEPVFESADGMGGEEGDDLADRYEELPPAVIDLTEDQLVWRNAEGAGTYVTTDLATGESTLSEREPRLRPTTGYVFWSPDGEHRVDATRTGRLRVSGAQPDFGHRWQTQGGWRSDHTLLALGQDRYRFAYDPAKPDTIPGGVVFPGIDVQP